jgi:3-polyprenyl-4-hydroxybenzoate decarboxylase
MNMGSRLLLLATRGEQPQRRTPPPPPPAPEAVAPGIRALAAVGEAFLVAQVAQDADKAALRAALAAHPATREYLFHVLVSEDVPVDDPCLVLWGWFTRFDPLVDLWPARRAMEGNRLILHFPIAIDATWKPGYRQPVAVDPDRARLVDQRWASYGIPLPGEQR